MSPAATPTRSMMWTVHSPARKGSVVGVLDPVDTPAS
jgi:hypothetical protein